MFKDKDSIPQQDYYYLFRTKVLERLLHTYATVYFCYAPLIGLWFALISCFSPRTAFAGFLSLLFSWVWGNLLRVNPPGDLHLVNSLLCGLFLSAYYPISTEFILGLILVTLFISICVSWFCNFLWNAGKVPLMTLPFVLGTWLLILIFQHKQLPSLPSLLFINDQLPALLSWSWTNNFFSTLGGLLLVPYPLPGALVFLGLLCASRYLTLLAVCGYIVGSLSLYLLGYDFLIVSTGYNFILAAIALGGIFMVPNVFSFLVALCGSALSTIFIIALYKLLLPLQLPSLVLPFLLSVYFWLGGLGARIEKNASTLNLAYPVSPELTAARYRLECARGIHLDSTHISQPFLKEWHVAEDLIMEQVYFSRSSINDTDTEQELLAPVNALVLEMRDMAKVHHQKAPIDEQWGNFLLLRDFFGIYLVLPFLKTGSIKPKINDWITVGQPIAECDKQGDEYRMYFQVQKGVRTCSKKLKYHLSNVLSYQENQPKKFNLFYSPRVGDTLISAQTNLEFVDAIDLQPGLTRSYTIKHNKQYKATQMLQTGVALSGSTRLYAAKDCSVSYEETQLSLAFFDKQGPRNTLLDLWILALGLTPLTTEADYWYDQPALQHWPLNPSQRLLLSIVRPLGLNCSSHYSRTWNEEQQVWIQKAIHQASILPGINWEASTTALIHPKLGVITLSMQWGDEEWLAELIPEESRPKSS